MRISDDRRNLCDRGTRDDQLTKRRPDLTGVLQDRNHDSKRGCREDDADEKR